MQPAPGSVRGRRVGFWVAIVLVSLIVGIGILGFVMSILTYG